jgi:hypothetical protein
MYATPPDDVLWANGGPRMWFHIWPDTMAKQKNCEHEMLAYQGTVKQPSQGCVQDVKQGSMHSMHSVTECGTLRDCEWSASCSGQYQLYKSLSRSKVLLTQ